jgi:hypothetical protein
MTQPEQYEDAVGPTTVSQDLLAAAVGALMPLGAGLAIMIGYLWLDVFGAVLGAGAAIGWGVWWYKRRGVLFPKELRGKTVAGVAILVAVLGVVFAVSL